MMSRRGLTAALAGVAALPLAAVAPAVAGAPSTAASGHAASGYPLTAYITDDQTNMVTPIQITSPTDFNVQAGFPITSGSANTGVAASPDGSTLYVTVNSLSTAATAVVDAATHQVRTMVNAPSSPPGAEPWGVAVTPDGHHVLVANNNGINAQQGNTPDSMTEIDPSTNPPTSQTVSLSGVAAGSTAAAQFVAVAPDGSTAYVPVANGPNVLVPVNLATHTAGQPIHLVGDQADPVCNPSGLAVTPGGTVVVVGCSSNAVADVVSPGTGTVQAVQLDASSEGNVHQVAITPDGHTALVSWLEPHLGGQVSFLDLTKSPPSLGPTVTVPELDPEGMVVTPDGKTAVLTTSGSTYVIDLTQSPPAVSSTTINVAGYMITLAPSPSAPTSTTTATTQPTSSSGTNGDDGATATTDQTPGKPVTRLYGDNRIGTAIAVSKAEFPTSGSAHTAVLARYDSFADALAGGPLAALTGGPLLLTETNQLDPATLSEIQRVLPTGGTVFVLGGTAAMSPGVVSALQSAGYRVVRLAGSDRAATAVAIANQLGSPSTVFEATGNDFPDALSADAAAVVTKGAILLTNGSSQAPETGGYLSQHPSDTRYAIGHPAAAADPGARGIVGSDRFDTSAQVAARFFANPALVAAADGSAFPDALAGGPVAGAAGGPLLLVSPTGPLPQAVANYLSTVASSVKTLLLFGGPAVVPPSVEQQYGAAAQPGSPSAPPPSSQQPPTTTTTSAPTSGTAGTVSMTPSSGGFVFQNQSTGWVWVSFAIRNCQNVSDPACDSGGWAQTISLGPSGGGTASQSCALMEAAGGPGSYSYTIQWIPYSDPSNGNDAEPTQVPQYGPTVGTSTPVTEQAGTDHGFIRCTTTG